MRPLNRSRRLRLGSAGLSLLAVLSCASAVAQVVDTVTYRLEEKEVKGAKALEQKSGKIISEGYKFVVIDAKKNGETEQVKIPTHLVEAVKYGTPSLSLSNAYGSIQQGEFARAVTQLEAAQKENIAEGLKLKALLMEGQLKQRIARSMDPGYEPDKKAITESLTESAELFEDILKKMPDYRYAPDAHVGDLISLALLGQYDKAGEAASAILSKTDYPSQQKYRARIWKARLLALGQKKHQGAIKELEAIAAEAGKCDPPMEEAADEALLLKGICLRELRDYRTAESLLNQVGIEGATEELKAQALVCRGESLMERGEMREALFAFLRVVVLHFREKPLHAKALYLASRCAASEKVQMPDRAQDLKLELIANHPDTSYAQRARAGQ